MGYNPSYKWINPTYPIYNWGYNPLTSRGMSHQVGLSLQVPPGCPIDGHESGAVAPWHQVSGRFGSGLGAQVLPGLCSKKKDGLGNLGWVQYFGSVGKIC